MSSSSSMDIESSSVDLEKQPKEEPYKVNKKWLLFNRIWVALLLSLDTFSIIGLSIWFVILKINYYKDYADAQNTYDSAVILYSEQIQNIIAVDTCVYQQYTLDLNSDCVCNINADLCLNQIANICVHNVQVTCINDIVTCYSLYVNGTHDINQTYDGNCFYDQSRHIIAQNEHDLLHYYEQNIPYGLTSSINYPFDTSKIIFLGILIIFIDIGINFIPIMLLYDQLINIIYRKKFNKMLHPPYGHIDIMACHDIKLLFVSKIIFIIIYVLIFIFVLIKWK